MQLRLPIGEDDFEQVRKEYYFVDKSRLIRQFLDRHAAVTLFTRPRRFGKTLMLSMMRYFFDIEKAEEHRKLFDGLAIADDAEAMKEQGTRPVVFLTLRELKLSSWEKMESGLRGLFSELFRQYRFLLKDADMDLTDREDFEQIREGRANLVKEMGAISFLLRLLEQHYHCKPVLLLDEYDVPIQQGWHYHFYDEAIEFIRVMLTKALKTNPSLDFAVLTGVLRISKESIFSDLNNLKVDSVLNTGYPEAFGFTSQDVEGIAEDFDRQDKLPEIRKWYDGYRFGERKIEIYNPWSVLNYFDADCEPDAYWVNTSGNSILQEMMEHNDDETWERLQGVMQGVPIRANLREGFIYSEIHQNKNALYMMLLNTGYLTCRQVRRIGAVKRAELVLPNLELLTLYQIEVLERFHADRLSTDLIDLMQAFLDGDLATAQSGLSEYLKVLASSFDTGEKESFYHGFVLGMTAVLVPDYEVQSNKEAGYGRFDVAAFPKDVQNTGLIFEFKTAETEDALDAKADEALAQIAERDYEASFRVRGIEKVQRYGAAFCGKKVLLKHA